MSVKKMPGATRQNIEVDLRGSELCLHDNEGEECTIKKESMINVSFDFSGQHTIEWSQPIALRASRHVVALRPATCNMYHFPAVQPVGSGSAHILETGSDELKALSALLLLLAGGETRMACDGQMFRTYDNVGASPIHALIVGNNDASLAMSLKLMQAVPSLVEQVHQTTSFGLQLFNGESSLHVLIVN